MFNYITDLVFVMVVAMALATFVHPSVNAGFAGYWVASQILRALRDTDVNN